MRVGAQAFAAALREDRARLHAAATRGSVGASVLLAAVLLLVTWGARPAAVAVAWAAATAGMWALRGAVARLHARAGAAGVAAPGAVWLPRYRLAFALHGLAWGAAGLIWLPALDHAHLDLAVFIFTAIAAGSLVSSAFDLFASLLFVVPALAPLVLYLCTAGRAPALGLLVLLFMGAATFGALRAQRLAREAVQLRLQRLDDHHLLKQLLQSTDEGFWFIDNQGLSTDLNPAMARLLGRPREAVIGRSVFDFFDGPDLQTLRREVAARASGESGVYEIGITGPDGTRRHCINHATPLFDARGERIGSIGIWTEITARRQAEAALRTYEVVINSLSDLVAVVDQDKVYRLVNDAWCRAVGLAREQALGRRASEVLPDGGDAGRARALAACIERREIGRVRGPTRVAGLAGRIIETSYHPYGDDQGLQRHVVMVTRDVTEEEQARVAQQVSAEYLLRTLNATGDAIFASDADDPGQPVRFINEQMLQMWGIAAEAAAGLTPADIMAHATPLFVDAQAEVQRIAALVHGNQADEARLRLRDGRVLLRRCIPAQVQGRTIRVWSFRDITAEERALQLMQTAEAEQRALLDAFPGAIGRLDEHMTYTYANQRLADLMGLRRDELVGRTAEQLLGAERARQLREHFDRALGGEPVRYEHRHPAVGGAVPTEVAITLAPGTDPRTGQRAVYGFALDITERRQAEQALRESEAELRALLAAFPGYIAAVNQGLHYTYVNERLAGLVGRPAAEIVGRPVAEVLGPERAAVATAEVVQARQGQAHVVVRALPVAQTGRWIDLEVTHVAGTRQADGRQITYAFGIDVTARRRAEEALIAARDEAERANRAKSQFLSQMSHELRTPMNAILGFGQLLDTDRRRPLAPQHRAWVGEILRGAEHLLELINEVLDLGRIESGQVSLVAEPVAVAPLVEECLGLVQALARERGVRLQPPLATLAPLWVQADRTRLKQVLLNLLGNAIKYNRPEGRVTVAWQAEGEAVRVTVQDSGRGLSGEDRQRLFTPFERLHATHSGIEGTGIGLALSRHLVQAMGGSIGADSEPGVGSSFWLRLPAAGVAAATPPRPPREAAPGPGHADAPMPTQTVLYVEDNPVNTVLMEAILERLPGVRLVCAAMPDEGLRLARELLPALVLLDIQLPEMDGFEVLARLRADAATRHLPVVAVSANALAADVEAARAAGFAGYVTKPVDVGQLLQTVQGMLAGPAAAPAA